MQERAVRLLIKQLEEALEVARFLLPETAAEQSQKAEADVKPRTVVPVRSGVISTDLARGR